MRLKSFIATVIQNTACRYARFSFEENLEALVGVFLVLSKPCWQNSWNTP